MENSVPEQLITVQSDVFNYYLPKVIVQKRTQKKIRNIFQRIEIFEYSIFVIFNFREIVFEHLKVCLLLGVSIHREIFFENVLPDHAGEWRVMTRPGSFSHWLSLSRSDWLRASF